MKTKREFAMVKIFFVITGLGSGGAENMLWKLVSRLDRDKFEVVIVSLTNISVLEPKFTNLGIKIYYLNMKQGLPDPFGFMKFIRLLYREKPDLIHTWMYHSDLLGGVGGKFFRKTPVIWNIRNSTLDPKASKTSTKIIASLCGKLSPHIPEKIACCAQSAIRIHQEYGYDISKFTVIPNGFDTDLFKPNFKKRQQVRSDLGISEEDLVVGLIARYHPQKDHLNFLRAAAGISRKLPNVKFILCGSGVDSNNHYITSLIKRLNLSSKTHLLGYRDNINEINNALDVAVSSSFSGEAFSNSLGEAMASGIPCVSTDVGDASIILGNTGIIVSPQNSLELEHALSEMLSKNQNERNKIGKDSRKRIIDNFSLDKIALRYERLFDDVLNGASDNFTIKSASNQR